MEYSENLNLKLPDDNDPLNVSDLSENFEALDAAISEAGAIAAQKAFKVGDTLTTWRTDLGDNWLLCNGEAFDPGQLPKLAEITPGLATMAEISEKRADLTPDKSISGSIISHATDGETTAIVVSSESSSRLFYSSDGFRTISEVQGLAHGPYDKIFYTNNHWVFFFETYSSNASYTNRMYETEDITGSWTEHKFSSFTGSIQHLEYYDGKYWAFGNENGANNTGAWVGYFLDFNITGIPKTAVPSVANSNQSFLRTDKFEFFNARTDGTGFTRVMANTPDGPWVTGSTISTPEFSRLSRYATYQDGVIYGICILSSNNPSIYSYDGSTVKTAGVASGFGQANSTYLGPPVIARDSAVMIFAGKWLVAKKDMSSISVIPIDGAYVNSADDKNRLALDGNSIISSVFFPGGSGYYSAIDALPLYAVPKISIPQTYTYIKAKEEAQSVNQQADTPAP